MQVKNVVLLTCQTHYFVMRVVFPPPYCGQLELLAGLRDSEQVDDFTREVDTRKASLASVLSMYMSA